MSRWLSDLESQVRDNVPRDTILDSLPMLKLATGFMADASAESVRFSARNEALSNSARRAIWLKTLKYLRFALERDGILYHFQFWCLPFGLSSAPRVFTKIMMEVVAHLRRSNVSIVPY
ncbi:uncharacterized protein ACNLHF_015271 [Anomaloglossus baeobatrachus]